MIKPIRIAMIQKALSNDVKSALKESEDILSKFDKVDKIDLVLFPESWLVRDLYEKAGDLFKYYYSIIDFLREEAERISSYIVGGGLFKREEDGHYIVSPIISNKGELLGEQYKLNLFRVEKKYFRTKPVLVLFELNGALIGVEICYDINFPEISRLLTINGADLILNPSRIIAGGEDMWHLYIKARMLENRIPIVSVNVYLDGRYNGSSIAVEPVETDHKIVRPRILADLGLGEKIKIVEVDPSKSRDLRVKRVEEIKIMDNVIKNFRVLRV